MDRRQALISLMDRLAPNAAKLAQQVSLAVDDPVVYVRAHGRRLRERGIDAPVPRLPLVAVLDALAEKKLLAEIDVHAAAEDVFAVVDELASLPKKRGRFKTWESRDDLDDLDAEAALALAGEAIAGHGLALAALDTGSDSHPVVAIRSVEIDAIASLAKDAGFRDFVVFRGDGNADRQEDEELKRKLAAQKASIEAQIAVPNPVWRSFMLERRYFNVKVATLVIDVSEGELGTDDRTSTVQKFGTWEETKSAADAMIHQRLGMGYREVPIEIYRDRARAAKESKSG